ncbi:MAG: DNA repair protein RecN [Spirochaetia bacterium]
MLEELTIRNYAIIDSLTITFSKGLNILSGETGAGKSILIGALGLILGGKGETDSIRTGEEEIDVTGIMRIGENKDALEWCRSRDIQPEDGTIILRRTVKRSGRGQAYVQSVPVTKADLQNIGSLAADIHGQHEHQSLLKTDYHRALLDKFAGIEEEVERFGTKFRNLTALKRELEDMNASERERMREADILRFAVQEIEEAGLNPAEEDELNREKRILQESERLFSLLDQTYDSVAENRNGALAYLRTALQNMQNVAGIDTDKSELAERLSNLFYELEDVNETIRDYRGSLEFSPDQLEQCETRLAVIHRLEKKYGSTIKEVLQYAEEAKSRLEKLENWVSDKEGLIEKIRSLEKEVSAQAQEISGERKKSSKNLQQQIEKVLRTLGMGKSVFAVTVETRKNDKGNPSCGLYGTDLVEFRFTANPGEEMKPLQLTASGGETSRLMLAVKTVLAESDSIQCMVFDEIDAGIGGEVALAVGKHLKDLSMHKQVLCITHLASIAARADTHIKVEKRAKEGKTITVIDRIEGEGRIREIARMLAGDKTGSVSVEHARELIERYGVS